MNGDTVGENIEINDIGSDSSAKITIHVVHTTVKESPGTACGFVGRKIQHPWELVNDTDGKGPRKWHDDSMHYKVPAKGEGPDLSKFVFTLKVDGCCTVARGGKLFMRYEPSDPGKKLPVGAFLVGESNSKKPIYMRPLDPKIDKHAAKCMDVLEKRGTKVEDGSYELLGEKVNNNYHKLTGVHLSPHSTIVFAFSPEQKTFAFLEYFLKQVGIEGFVCYNPETLEMYKIRRGCFAGLTWPPKWDEKVVSVRPHLL